MDNGSLALDLGRGTLDTSDSWQRPEVGADRIGSGLCLLNKTLEVVSKSSREGNSPGWAENLIGSALLP